MKDKELREHVYKLSTDDITHMEEDLYGIINDIKGKLYNMVTKEDFNDLEKRFCRIENMLREAKTKPLPDPKHELNNELLNLFLFYIPCKTDEELQKLGEHCNKVVNDFYER